MTYLTCVVSNSSRYLSPLSCPDNVSQLNLVLMLNEFPFTLQISNEDIKWDSDSDPFKS